MDLPPWGPPIGTQYGHHHSKIPSIVVYFEPSVIWAENINPGAIEEVKSQNWPFFVFFQKMTPPLDGPKIAKMVEFLIYASKPSKILIKTS